jgi:hypothetical protein
MLARSAYRNVGDGHGLSGEQWEVPKSVAGQLGNFYALKVFYWSIETRVNEAFFLRESQYRQRVQQSLGT